MTTQGKGSGAMGAQVVYPLTASLHCIVRGQKAAGPTAMTDDTKSPYRSPVSIATAGCSASAWEKRERFALVLAMYLISVVGSVIGVFRPEESVIGVVPQVAICSIMTYWWVVDSRVRGFPIVQSLHWIILFTWPIAVPIYLIWSRKLRGLGLVFVHAIGLFAVGLAAYHLTGYLAYGEAWSDAFRR